MTSSTTSPPLLTRVMEAVSTRARHAINSARHAPLEVAMGVLMAIAGCWCISEGSNDDVKLFFRGAMMFYPAIIGVLAMSILARFGKISAASRWGISFGFVGLSIAYACLRLDPDLYITEMWRWLTLCLGVTAGFALLPLVLIKGSARRTREFFWSFNVRLLNHIGLSISFLGALTLGLAFALAAAHELLGIHIPDRAFGYMVMVLLVGLTPWQVITILPGMNLEVETPATAVKQLGRIMCTYLFLPLMSIYLVILYLYQGQVVLAGMNAPKNMMSPLVLAAAGMLLTGMLLADQLEQEDSETRGVFLKVIDRLPMLFLPLMPMSAWAVWIRIEQYGWTEFRYLRLMLIIALSVIFVLAIAQYFRKRPQPLMAIIGTFGVLSIVSTFGPLSAQAVSQRSQLTRLRMHLAADDALDATGKFKSPRALSGSRTSPDLHPLSHQSISTITYLAEHFGAAPFEELVSPYQFERLVESMDGRGLNSYEVLNALGAMETEAQDAMENVLDLNFHTTGQLGHAPHSGILYKLSIYSTNHPQTLNFQAPIMGEEDVPGRITLNDSHISMEFGPSQDVILQTRHELKPLLDFLAAKHDHDHIKLHFALEVPEHLRVFSLSEEGTATITVSLHGASLSRSSVDDPWEFTGLQGIIVQNDGLVPRE